MAEASVLQRVRELSTTAVALGGDFDADTLYPHDAIQVVGEARRIINVMTAIEASAAERVAQGQAWNHHGARSPEDWLSRQTGTSQGSARKALGTARRRKKQSELDAASRRGEVSGEEADEIGRAAEADPTAENRLVKKARKKKGTLKDLREECERTRARAEADPDASHRRRRQGRSLRKRTCEDGSTEVTHHSTTEETAEIWAACVAVAHRLFLGRPGQGHPPPRSPPPRRRPAHPHPHRHQQTRPQNSPHRHQHR